MGRPRYETKADRSSQDTAIQYFCRQLGLRYEETGAGAYHDGVLYEKDDKVPAFVVEYKRRNIPRTKFSTYIISAAKIRNVFETADDLNTIPLLLVEWTDGLYYHLIEDPSSYDTKEGGRWDRGDAADVEQMAHISIDSFNKV